jgi:hypothetical protein
MHRNLKSPVRAKQAKQAKQANSNNDTDPDNAMPLSSFNHSFEESKCIVLIYAIWGLALSVADLAAMQIHWSYFSW